jgi:hypothetical protein
MRKIKHGHAIDELVKLGETVELVGFYTEPIIATAVRGTHNCTGCALEDTDNACSVHIEVGGKLRLVGVCCIKPSWITKDKKSTEFCIYKQQGAALEEL